MNHEEELNKDINRYSLNELLTSDIVTDEWLQMIRQEIRFIQQSFERKTFRTREESSTKIEFIGGVTLRHAMKVSDWLKFFD